MIHSWAVFAVVFYVLPILIVRQLTKWLYANRHIEDRTYELWFLPIANFVACIIIPIWIVLFLAHEKRIHLIRWFLGMDWKRVPYQPKTMHKLNVMSKL